MEQNRFFFWWKVFTVTSVSLGMAWMFYELLRVGRGIMEASGIAAVFSDGVVLHKIGELLIAGPFVIGLFLPMFWQREDRDPTRILTAVRIALLVGGLLNGVAWLSLRYRVDWHPWCLILLAWGVVGFLFIRKISLTTLEKRRRLNAEQREPTDPPTDGPIDPTTP